MKTFLMSLVVAVCFMAGNRSVAAPELQGSSPATASRPSNEAVFDRNKGAIYALYGCALCERIKQFRFAPQTPTTFTKELTLISAA